MACKPYTTLSGLFPVVEGVPMTASSLGGCSAGSGMRMMTTALWDDHSSNKSMASTLAVSRTNLQHAC